MGGNVAIMKGDKQIKAQKIPIKEIGLKNFQKDFKEMFKKLNKMFYKKYGYYIWDTEKILDNGYVFNGSTSFLMDTNNLSKEEEILQLKPTSGDIDIMVPENIKEDLWNFLKEIEDKQITDKITYLGNNKPTISSIGEQINALFKYCYKKDKCVYSQVDFEFVPFEEKEIELDNSRDVNGNIAGNKVLIPLEWSKFSHSSSLRDLEKQIKGGVFHKYLLRSLSYAVSQINPDNVVFVTSSANCDNYEKKISRTKNPDNHLLKFSVSRGIRVAYEPLICDGEPVYIDGKQVFRKLKTSESIYATNLKDIFKMIFGKEPTKSDLDDFWSFAGLVNLMKKYLSKKQIQLVFQRLLQLLWENKNGKNIAQELERDNPELDMKIKMAGVNYMLKEFPYLKKEFDKWQKKIEDYYNQYGMRESLIEIIIHNIRRIND